MTVHTQKYQTPFTPEQALMFQARKHQFVDRLGWDLKVTGKGFEIDQFDDPDAFYLIDIEDGRHLASARIRPNTAFGRMTPWVFPALLPSSDMIPDYHLGCELSRLCGDDIKAMFNIGRNWWEQRGRHEYSFIVAVYEVKMLKLYRRAGWEPETINQHDGLCVGIWR